MLLALLLPVLVGNISTVDMVAITQAGCVIDIEVGFPTMREAAYVVAFLVSVKQEIQLYSHASCSILSTFP